MVSLKQHCNAYQPTKVLFDFLITNIPQIPSKVNTGVDLNRLNNMFYILT